jgi:hypothetical protein
MLLPIIRAPPYPAFIALEEKPIPAFRDRQAYFAVAAKFFCSAVGSAI